MKLKKIPILIIYSFLTLPSIVFFRFYEDSNIYQDISRWCDIKNITFTSNLLKFVFLMTYFKEFRNLFYYRLKISKNIIFRVLFYIQKFILRELPTLFLSSNEIGPGLFIQHGYGTIIAAEKLGENCWINQNVTIGYDEKNKSPKIGNNVRIAAGAVVFGNISIGDNSTIGPNAIIAKNVPQNCVVVAQPAYIVKKDGRLILEKLD